MWVSSSRTRSAATEASAGDGRPRESLRLRLDGEVELVAEPQDAEDAHGVVGERRRPARTEPPVGEIVQAAGGVLDRRRSAEQRVEVDGERIDGDIAPGEVRLEAGPPEVGQVDLEWRGPGQDHARHAVRLAERHERAPEPIREAPSRRSAPVREREVDIVKRPREQEVPDRAADQPGRAADRLGDRREKRPQRIEGPSVASTNVGGGWQPGSVVGNATGG